MPELAHTSLPSWVAGAAGTDPDRTGASFLLVGVGVEALGTIQTWVKELDGAELRILRYDDAASAGVALGQALAEARVGVRVRVAGPVGACLAVRGVAVSEGLEDDELHVAPTAGGTIDVFCSHCRAVTRTGSAIGAVVECEGCSRSLAIYHHVSRRTGHFLGYKADAEENPE